MFYENQDVVKLFLEAKNRYMNKSVCVLAKDTDVFFSKLNRKEQENIVTICNYMNTKWQNISLSKYFDCGFELFSTKYTCKKVLDPSVLELYIIRDKEIKRSDVISREIFDGDMKFIKNWMSQRSHKRNKSLMTQYCEMKEDDITAPIKHYILNKIGKHMVAWLISKKHLKLRDEDRRLIPLVLQNYWNYTKDLSDIGERGIIYGDENTQE